MYSLKLVLTSSVLDNLLLFLFVRQRQVKTIYTALQLFKGFDSFVPKVDVTVFRDTLIWIGILSQCLYQKDWTQVNVKKLSQNTNVTDSTQLKPIFLQWLFHLF